jgi:putative tryptophan/tyrosine transport system substrate-binding protein
MRRREFFGLVSGAVVGWPLVARAQQGERVRRVGVLFNGLQSDPELLARSAALQTVLKDLGWTIGSNVQIDYRFAFADEDISAKAKELIALSPDVLVANAPPSVMAMLRSSRTIPIVFAAVTDPVGLGIVQSLARPGGNATGFLSAEFSFGAKWLELLKEIAPGVRRVAVLTDPGNRGAAPQFATVQAVGRSLGVDEVIPLSLHDRGEIERGIKDFARSANGGLIALRISEAITQADLIVKLAAEHRLPAVYPLHLFVASGGLASYGPDIVDQYRQAAGYVDRILKGAKPADLPVQTPTKYELAINLKTAKTLGVTLPPALLARADKIIE